MTVLLLKNCFFTDWFPGWTRNYGAEPSSLTPSEDCVALRQSFPGLEPDAVTSVEDEDVGGKYKESQNSADSNSVALIYSGFKNAALSKVHHRLAVHNASMGCKRKKICILMLIIEGAV